VVVGLGNIGSQLVDHLGRMGGVARVVLVDRDVYESANLHSQRILPQNVGKPKAAVQRRILQAINPALEVCAVVDDVGNVPQEQLRANLVVGCLDSIEARLVVNERAWRMGVPWLDGGVEPSQQLVRVNGYFPGPENPCFECALEERDYGRLASRHPCQSRAGTPAATNAPTSLGALAAALLAGESAKIIAGDFTRSLVGRQVVIDAAFHRHYVTSFRRNPDCRFDHAVWRLEPLRGLKPTDRLEDLLAAGRRAVSGDASTRLMVEYHPWVNSLHCPFCGRGVKCVHVLGRLARRCPHCPGRQLIPSGFTTGDPIDANSPGRILRRTLRAAGVRFGDVVRVETGNQEARFVISNDPL
jgi:molybdopterin/thiamine biosynthesis adenylyltransferase